MSIANNSIGSSSYGYGGTVTYNSLGKRIYTDDGPLLVVGFWVWVGLDGSD